MLLICPGARLQVVRTGGLYRLPHGPFGRGSPSTCGSRLPLPGWFMEGWGAGLALVRLRDCWFQCLDYMSNKPMHQPGVPCRCPQPVCHECVPQPCMRHRQKHALTLVPWWTLTQVISWGITVTLPLLALLIASRRAHQNLPDRKVPSDLLVPLKELDEKIDEHENSAFM